MGLFARALVFVVALSFCTRAEEPKHEGKTAAEWKKALGSQDKKESDAAPYALSRFGPSAVPLIIAALKSDELKIRRGAAQSLAEMGPPGKSAVPALVAMLEEEKDLQTQGTAIWALLNIGKSSAPAVPLLTKLLDHENPEMRAAAMGALGAIGPAASGAVTKIVSLLKENIKNRRVAHVCAHALRDIGMKEAEAKTAIPLLVEGMLTEHSKGNDINYHAEALIKTGKFAVPALIDLLKSGDGKSRCLAGCCILRIGPDAKESLPFLWPALEEASRLDESDYMKSFYLGPIVACGADDPKVAALIKNALMQEKNTFRWGAVVEGLGYGGEAALPYLLDGLRNNEPATRGACAAAMSHGAFALDKKIPALKLALTDTDAKVRDSAAWSLGQFGPAARDALPTLKKIVSEQKRDPYRKSRAEEAIEKIEKKEETD
jgi:HEAT repeat protein